MSPSGEKDDPALTLSVNYVEDDVPLSSDSMRKAAAAAHDAAAMLKSLRKRTDAWKNEVKLFSTCVACSMKTLRQFLQTATAATSPPLLSSRLSAADRKSKQTTTCTTCNERPQSTTTTTAKVAGFWRGSAPRSIGESATSSVRSDGEEDGDDSSGDRLEKQPALHPAVLEALCARLKLSLTTTTAVATMTKPRPLLSSKQVRLVRRSVDGRPNQQRVEGAMGPRYLYVLDVDIDPATLLLRPWKNQPGRLELLDTPPLLSDVDDDDDNKSVENNKSIDNNNNNNSKNTKPRVVILGAGPAGLFCALQLA